MNIVDPHLHLFDRQLGEYGWLSPDNPPHWPDKQIINNDFSTNDLILPTAFNLTGFVHIEAGFDNQNPNREIEWLEQTIDRPFKSIACIDITTEALQFQQQLTQLERYPSLVGVRHILDEQALAILSHPNTQSNLSTLADNSLLFECQMSAHDTQAINQLIQVLTNIPHLVLVINHAAFPLFSRTLGPEQNKLWQKNLIQLAMFENVYIKSSGWEMHHRSYTATFVKDITSSLIDIFGVQRVMLASNFPLCLFSQSYKDLWLSYSQLPYSSNELKALIESNARRIYQL